MRRIALAVLFAITATGTAAAGPRCVLELFTSQGCSSCPAADKLIRAWARRPDVVALSLPVDYWDYLGWKDTLASPAFTRRQKAYAKARGDRAVYTPQVVVNGLAHVVGSDAAAIEAAVDTTRARTGVMSVPVAIADSVGGYIASIGPGPETGEIWLVSIERAARVAIGRGENGGATVVYANVARGMHKIGDYRGRPMTLTLSREEIAAPDADGFVLLVQRSEDGRPGAILGAAIEPAN